MDAARQMIEHGLPSMTPAAVIRKGTLPEQQRVRSVAIVLPEDLAFIDAARDALRAEPGKPHASV